MTRPGWVRRGLWALLMGGASILAGPLGLAAGEEGTRSQDWRTLTRAGGHLSAQEAEALESQVAANPADVSARSRLLGYYFTRRQRPEARQADQRHALWMIENRSAEPISGSPYVSLDPHLDGEAYTNARALWLRHVEAHGDDTALLRNAASFFTVYDRVLSERLFKKAQELDPSNPEWNERLGHLYSLSSNAPGKDPAAAAGAVAQYESALAGDSSRVDRYHVLADLSKAAFVAGDFDKARDRAAELLALVEGAAGKGKGDHGDGIHDGNVMLGRVALHDGDIEAARDRLRRAGETPGSPVLNSFGPDLSLANELLAKGQREAVLDYLRQCSRFWKSGQGALEHWISEIQAGGTPELERFQSYRYRSSPTAERRQ